MQPEEPQGGDWIGRVLDGIQRLQSGQVLTQKELAVLHQEMTLLKKDVERMNEVNNLRLQQHELRLSALETATKGIEVDRNNTRWIMTLLAFISSIAGGFTAKLFP